MRGKRSNGQYKHLMRVNLIKHSCSTSLKVFDSPKKENFLIVYKDSTFYHEHELSITMAKETKKEWNILCFRLLLQN